MHLSKGFRGNSPSKKTHKEKNEKGEDNVVRFRAADTSAATSVGHNKTGKRLNGACSFWENAIKAMIITVL